VEIKIIKDFQVRNQQMLVGDIYKARYLPGGPIRIINSPIQVIEGKFSGELVPQEHCILLPKEKAYSEKEWNDMENYYLKELDEAREEKKIPVPQEVAEAIEKARNQNAKFSILSNFNLLDAVNRALRCNWHGGNCISVIATWISGDMAKRDILLKALVNGYTIEETKEERINKGLKELVETWLDEDSLGSNSKDADQLSTRIKGFVQGVYAESTS
jgi:hypothetical protein